jgi:hypothetical protein
MQENRIEIGDTVKHAFDGYGPGKLLAIHGDVAWVAFDTGSVPMTVSVGNLTKVLSNGEKLLDILRRSPMSVDAAAEFLDAQGVKAP